MLNALFSNLLERFKALFGRKMLVWGVTSLVTWIGIDADVEVKGAIEALISSVLILAVAYQNAQIVKAQEAAKAAIEAAKIAATK